MVIHLYRWMFVHRHCSSRLAVPKVNGPGVPSCDRKPTGGVVAFQMALQRQNESVFVQIKHEKLASDEDVIIEYIDNPDKPSRERADRY
jgi:hypothetical protein